jgi:predicted aspartyl protease
VNFPFDAGQGLIIIETALSGPNGSDTFRFGLDTGATETVVSVNVLALLGYGFSLDSERVRLIMGGGAQFADRVVVQRIVALGQERSDFSVLAYTLPPEIGVYGMLGLDFLRGLKLTVDFREGRLSLE